MGFNLAFKGLMNTVFLFLSLLYLYVRWVCSWPLDCWIDILITIILKCNCYFTTDEGYICWLKFLYYLIKMYRRLELNKYWVNSEWKAGHVVCVSAGYASTTGVIGNTTRSFQKGREIIPSQSPPQSVCTADDHLGKDTATELNLASM